MFDTEQGMDFEQPSPSESLCIPYKLTKCSNIVSGEVEASRPRKFIRMYIFTYDQDRASDLRASAMMS